jgi:potassium-transporting ATPase KdpC subunit
MGMIRAALVLTILMVLLTGMVYPFAVTGIAHVTFPNKANGSLIERGGVIIGSSEIGQSFTADKYFHGRPSATTGTDPNDATKTVSVPYNAANSGGSNLGPTNKSFIDGVKASAEKLHAENPAQIPVDLVTASGSGIDPDITPAAAQYQATRVAMARNLPEPDIAQLIAKNTKQRLWGLFGEPRINVLKLNMGLDDLEQSKKQ